MSVGKNMNSTKLAFRARQWEEGHQFVSLCVMTTSLLASELSTAAGLRWAKNHDLWKIQTFTASQRGNDSSNGHKSQVMSDTAPTLSQDPLIVPIYNSIIQTTNVLQQGPLIHSLYFLQCLLWAHEYHILKADYICLWHATFGSVHLLDIFCRHLLLDSQQSERCEIADFKK